MDKALLFIFMVFMLWASGVLASETVINDDCVYLHELVEGSYPALAVQCGFRPGDRKILPANVVSTTLKRAALPVPELPAAFTVSRQGYRLTEEIIQAGLESLYATGRPDSEIEIQSVRLSRDIHIAPGAEFSINTDTDKAGSVSAQIVSGDIKVPFAYTVRIYQEGWIATGRVAQGEEFAANVEFARVDVTGLKGNLALEIDGMIAKRTVPKGKAITSDMLENRPERVKGDPIRLIYDNSVIKIEIAVIAEGNAVPGKTFPVKNPVSDKVFMALYQGDGTAVVY